MKRLRAHFVLQLMLLIAVSFWARAAEEKWKLPPETARLKPGPGSQFVAQCLLCHSADYISTQPPQTRIGWTASVNKMREKYGAPIATNQVEEIVGYLVRNYGSEKTP